MDLSNFTIPPELFYSKPPPEVWRPKATVKISPKKVAKVLKKSRGITYKRKVARHVRGPELGRIGKIKRSLIKKKLIKKKSGISSDQKENVNNNNNANLPLSALAIKRTTKQEERSILQDIKAKEEAIKKRIFSSNTSFKRKRSKGSSFKFFKTKNNREDESSSDESDDLVPEIHDYSDDSYVPLNTSTEGQSDKQSSFVPLVDEAPFEAEEVELSETTAAIESLLKNLDKADDEETNEIVKTAIDPLPTLDGLIETLKGSPEKSVTTTKKKFLGFGSNQLQIDAGQTKFGLVECKDCGFSYNTNVPEDEKLHNQHHHSVTSIPIFRGWAAEDAMAINEWKELNGRIIRLLPNHKNMKSDFVKEIVEKMELEFGLQDDYEQHHLYLAVQESKFVGLAIVKDSVKAHMNNEEKEIRLGVQRLFVRPQFRRKGIARAILKTIVILHEKGELLDLRKDVAFSTPTDDGKQLIESVTGSDEFFVFSS